MFKKESIKVTIKEFFSFDTLITERVLRNLFIFVTVVAIVATFIGIIAGWVAAFALIRYRFGSFLFMFVGTPVIAAIGLAITLFLMRLSFESVLIRFLLYREVKSINDAGKGGVDSDTQSDI